MKCTIFLLLLIIVIKAKDNPIYAGKYKQDSTKQQLKVHDTHFFKQVVDHYDYSSLQYWDQKYWVISQYFNPRIGPVFYFVCGQYPCDSNVLEHRQWTIILAQKLQGIVIGLQHRFYGDSLPFGKDSFSLKNMILLNSQQALRDLSYFQTEVIKNQMFGITNNPWISVGGSYPGALSAWYRYKYPHLVIGSIASSAVINVIQDFKDFDQQIYKSSIRSGDFCSQALNASNYKVQQILNSSENTAFKSQFSGAQKLNDNQFLFYWADAIVLTIQYGGRTNLCDKLKGKTADQQFAVIVENNKEYPPHQYGSYYLSNQTFTYETKSMARPWYYQYCSEFGWFQTYSLQHPMRSTRINLTFFQQFCDDSFGQGIWPKVQRKNTQYGGLFEKSSNIIFVNGVQDPWIWASLQNSTREGIIARVADCQDCGHCVDLNTPQADDSVALKKIRDESYLTISEWIETYWQDQNKNKLELVLFNTQ